MNKKSYRLFLIVLTVCCVLVGTLAHMGRFPSEEEQDAFDPSGYADSWTTEPFTALDLNLQGGTVHLYEGTDGEYGVDYSGPQELRPEFTVQDGVLRVSQVNGQSVSLAEASEAEYWINLGGYGLESGSVHLGSGSLLLESVRCADCTVSCEAGTIEVTNCSFQSLQAEIETGAFRMNDASCQNMEARITTGEAELVHQIPDNQSIRLETGLGNILVNDESSGSVWERAILGDDVCFLHVQVEVGDIIFYTVE